MIATEPRSTIVLSKLQQYILNQMRRGPRYDAQRRMMCVPHRWKNPDIAAAWEKRKFEYDPIWHEYRIVIRAGYSDAEIQASLKRCRDFYFAMYALFNPNVTPMEVKA